MTDVAVTLFPTDLPSHWMMSFEAPQLSLVVRKRNEYSKDGTDGNKPKKHLPGMHKANQQVHDDDGKEVIGLVIKEIVHNSVGPSFGVIEIGRLKPRGLQQIVLQRTKGSKFHVRHFWPTLYQRLFFYLVPFSLSW